MTRRTFLTHAGLACSAGCVAGRDAVNPVAHAREFLASLFDKELDLLPEFRGSRTYCLYHDSK